MQNAFDIIQDFYLKKYTDVVKKKIISFCK